MIRHALRALVVCALVSTGLAAVAQEGRTLRWSFEDGAPGSLPPGFEALLGEWKIEVEATAPSASHVLRQTGTFRGPDFPRIVVQGQTFGDLTLRVRCRPESGRIDQACGVVFRLQDGDDYYLARANALEGNVRLYRVVKGDRQQLASADAKVTSNAWHGLAVTARGRKLEVRWDGALVIEASDASFAAGRIGLWTKADSVTAFDDLEAVAE